MGISPNLPFRCSWAQRFEIRRSKVEGQDHCKTIYCQISTVGGIFFLVSGMYGRILVKLVIVIDYQVHMTVMTFSRSRVQRSRLQTTSYKNTLSGRGIPMMVCIGRPSSWDLPQQCPQQQWNQAFLWVSMTVAGVIELSDCGFMWVHSWYLLDSLQRLVSFSYLTVGSLLVFTWLSAHIWSILLMFGTWCTRYACNSAWPSLCQ